MLLPVSHNCIKTLLANVLGTLPIKCNPLNNNDPKTLLKTPPDCPIL